MKVPEIHKDIHGNGIKYQWIPLKNDFLVNGFEIVMQLYEEKKLNPLLSSNATINYTCAKYFKENDENIKEKWQISLQL